MLSNEYRTFKSMDIKDKLVYKYFLLNHMLVNNKYDKTYLKIIDSDIKDSIKSNNYYKVINVKDIKEKDFLKEFLKITRQ